jgi:hypothetical protein
MLSGARRDRPVIVGWSTALRGQVINESLGQLPKKLQRAIDPAHYAGVAGANGRYAATPPLPSAPATAPASLVRDLGE